MGSLLGCRALHRTLGLGAFSVAIRTEGVAAGGRADAGPAVPGAWVSGGVGVAAPGRSAERGAGPGQARPASAVGCLAGMHAACANGNAAVTLDDEG